MMNIKMVHLAITLPLLLVGCYTLPISSQSPNLDKIRVNIRIEGDRSHPKQQVILKFSSLPTECNQASLIKSTMYVRTKMGVTCDFATNLSPSFTVYYAVRPLGDADYFDQVATAVQLKKKYEQNYVLELNKIEEQFYQQQDAKVVDYANALPTSAWKSYEINPQKLREQYWTTPVDMFVRKPQYVSYHPLKFPRGTNLKIKLLFDAQGNVKPEIKHENIGMQLVY